MKEKVILEASFNCSAKELYNHWLSSDGHTKMTGGEAEIDDQIGSSYSAWDGYITGENLELHPYSKIVQTWRTSEFEDSDENSNLILELEDQADGCLLKLTHTNIPAGQTQYLAGWKEHYFEPMTEYFNGL